MATWKKVLVEGADLQSTTDFTNNTGALAPATNGGIRINGGLTAVDDVLLGSASVTVGLDINALQSATPAEATDLIAFYDASASATKRAGISAFVDLFAGTVTDTGLDSSGVNLVVDIAGQTPLGTPAGTEEVMVWDGTALKKTTINAISTAGSGDVTSVTAGDGLTGTGETGPDVVLNVGAGDGITVTANAVSLATTTAGNGLTYTSGVLAVGEGSLIDVSADAIAVDLTEAAAATIAAGDNLIFLDGGATGAASKGSVNDLAALLAGDGLTATGAVLSVDDIVLGTDTTGAYVANVIGTTNEIEVSGSAGGTYTVGLPNNVTITNDLTVGGDLTITGEINRVTYTELEVTDKTILVAKGASATGTADLSGIVVDSSGLSSHANDASMLFNEAGASFSEWKMTKSEGATPKDAAWVAGMAVGTSQTDLNTNYDCGLGSLGWDGTNLYIQTA